MANNSIGPQKESYLGNPHVKRDGVSEEWTLEKIKEYKKCSEDPIYFIEKYMKIISLDDGLIPMKLWDFQKDYIRHINEHRFNVVLAARQSSKSTSSIAFLLWYSLFHADKTIFLLANKGDTARELFGRFTLALENIPFFLQPGTKALNKSTVEFSNNTKVMARATSASSIRGNSASVIMIDEMAFIENAEEFMRSTYPVITAGKSTKVIIVSTPNGVGNAFHDIWSGAVTGTNEYKPFTIKWDDVPGRDQKFKEETIRNIGKDAWSQEFEVEFHGSSRTLINGGKLLGLKMQTPIYTLDGGTIRIYSEPKKNHDYIMTVDVARGRGKDYSTFTIIDITQEYSDKDNDNEGVFDEESKLTIKNGLSFEQVAVFSDNMISPLLFPNVIEKYCKMYNNAYCIIESNDNGVLVANGLFYDLEYDNIFTEVRGGRMSLGAEMNKAVKRNGCSNLKDLIETDTLKIYDKNTINELCHFVESGKSYEADTGYHDDLAMNLVMFGWFTNAAYFRALTDIELRTELYSEEVDRIENELLPFGIIDDGIINEENTGFTDTLYEWR